uniref:Actin-related protein 2/3 complex subunit 2 n=1 Tax=Cajanus cajan TaxID=3821 RepID=A0A151SJP1_CAJCA|nr:putative actin-related protein 2/3 complex subunit 2 [Cajanus cajan]
MILVFLNPNHEEKNLNPSPRSCNFAIGIHDTPAVPFKIPAPDLIESGPKFCEVLVNIAVYINPHWFCWRIVDSLDKGVELDHHWVEFDDVRYHIQVSMKNPHVLLLSVSLPTPSSETIFVCGLPFGAIEAIKAAYGNLVQILDPPRDGFNLTLKINLSKLPANQVLHQTVVVLRSPPPLETLAKLGKNQGAKDLGRNLKRIHINPDSQQVFHQRLKHYKTMKTAREHTKSFQLLEEKKKEEEHAQTLKHAYVKKSTSLFQLEVADKKILALVSEADGPGVVENTWRTRSGLRILALADKVTVVYPMRFHDSIDIVLATSFLQEFVEARRTAGLHNTPPCSWSLTPPLELKGVAANALSANAGFVTFVIFPRHVEGQKLDRTVWNLSTFHAYVSYHVKNKRGTDKKCWERVYDVKFVNTSFNTFKNVQVGDEIMEQVLGRIYAYTDAASCGVLDSEPQGFKDQLIFIKEKHGEEDVLVLLDYTIANQGIAIACLQNVPDACNSKM